MISNTIDRIYGMKTRVINKWNNAEIDFLKDNFQLLSDKKISEKLNRSYCSIRGMRKHLNLIKSDTGLKNSLINKQKKYNINLDFFVNPSNEQQFISGYILGFLWADGYVRKPNSKVIKSEIILSIVEEDAVDIIPLFALSGNWSIKTFQSKKWKPKTDIKIFDNNLYNYLISMDYCDKSIKSPDKILHNKSQIFESGFWRGFLDGDGCYIISERNNNKLIFASGSIHQDWIRFEEFLKKNEITYSIYPKNRFERIQGSSRLVVTNFDNLLKLINIIYTNNEYDEIGLKRKFNKASSIRNHIINYLQNI